MRRLPFLLLLGCHHPAAVPTSMPASRPAAATTVTDRCAAGDRAACDELAEKWQAVELLPAGQAPATADAAALQEACDKHDLSVGCVTYALMAKYGTANGVRSDEAAAPYWKRTRQLGDLNGFRGEAPDAEGAAALATAEKECANGRARACVQRGWAAFSGVQEEADVPAAYRWYAKGCDLGSAQGCRWTGHIAYTHPEAGATVADAKPHLEHACELGNPGGCDELGELLEFQHHRKAAQPIWEKACQMGSRDGCLHAGLGKQKEDPDGARPFLCTACQAGAADACKAVDPPCQ